MMIALYGKYSIMDPLWHVRHLGLYFSNILWYMIRFGSDTGWAAGAHYSPEFIKTAKLLHWNGSFKPWNGVSSFGDVWEKYFVPDPSGVYKPVRKHG
jgi:hypothetical protein